MSPLQLIRLLKSRTLDDYDDEKPPTQIQNAEVESLTSEQLQQFIISQIRQILGTLDWKDPVPIDLDSVLSFVDGQRTNQELLATADPRVWKTAEYFRHDPAGLSIDVWHNGRHLTQSPTGDLADGEYQVFEEVPGNGYDSIRLLRWNPNARSRFRANYVAAD